MVKKAHSLYRMVYRTLRGRILSGQYDLGAQIETEPELAKQFKTSLITIRQAAQMLTDEGLLDKQQGRGTFVPPSARKHLKILCVCGLDLAEGLQQSMGSYHAELIILSQGEAERRGLEFETVWLPHRSQARVRPYCVESVIREYWGVVFIACGSDHMLLQRVRDLQMRHVAISGHQQDAGRWVWLDQKQAIRIALEAVGGTQGNPPVVMGIDNLRREVDAVLGDTSLPARQLYVAGADARYSFETAGYLKMQEAQASGMDLSRVVFLDDIVAHGATRALLQGGYGGREVRYAVICGLQDIMPMGFPMHYVVHDAAAEVSRAFSILEQPCRGGADASASWRCGYRLAGAEEVAARGALAAV